MVCSVNTGRRTCVWHVILVGLFLELPSVVSAATPFLFRREKHRWAFWHTKFFHCFVTNPHRVTPVASGLAMACSIASSHDGALLCPHLRASWQMKWLRVKVKTWRLKEKEEPGKCFLGIGEDVHSSTMTVSDLFKLQSKIRVKNCQIKFVFEKTQYHNSYYASENAHNDPAKTA